MKKIIFTLTSLAFLGLSTANAQVGIGTNTPNASAVLELESTDKGFLPPRMETAERDAIASPVEGLTIYNTDNNCLEFFDGTDWISACDGSVVTSPPTITSGACQGQPVTIIFEGLEYKPVESGPTNNKKCWLDRNLGATRVATSSDDFEAYGSLYQWGRGRDGHEEIGWTSSTAGTPVNGTTNTLSTTNQPTHPDFITPNTTDDDWRTSRNDDLWQGVNGINNPCPSGYRVPTEAEWNDELSSWGSNNDNTTGAFNSPLNLPAAGGRSRTGLLFSFSGQRGYYWSSDVVSTSPTRSRYFMIQDTSTSFVNAARAFGYSVRCIKD